MSLAFYSYEVPVAYSMFALARRAPKEKYQPFQEYVFCWTAFNNIYTTIADYEGHSAQLKMLKDGTIVTRQEGSVKIVEVEAMSERKQINLACDKFSEDLRHRLITHENTRFFGYRIPSWHGRRIEHDINGQELNGVINVSRTVSTDYPVWSPIDINLYEYYLANDQDVNARNNLAKQIVKVLYTVRNNRVIAR